MSKAKAVWSGGSNVKELNELKTKGFFTVTGEIKDRQFTIPCGCGGHITIGNIGICKPDLWAGSGWCNRCQVYFTLSAGSESELPDVLAKAMRLELE